MITGFLCFRFAFSTAIFWRLRSETRGEISVSGSFTVLQRAKVEPGSHAEGQPLFDRRQDCYGYYS